MTPKGRERLGRLERRLEYVEKQLRDDVAEGRDRERAYHYRKAEASALTWATAELKRLDRVVEQLKALKLTFRNVPRDAAPADGACLFTGEPAVERIYVARTY